MKLKSLILILSLFIITSKLFCQTYINGYVVYSTPQYPQGDIIINPESELVVTSEIHFTEDAKLIVKRTGKLTIDGGTLTNLDSNMWRGIEVWGNAFQPQSTVYQGKVEIINGGEIEYAQIGIRTIKAEDTPIGGGENVDSDYTGGIVIASNSTFTNNRIAVQFYPYQHQSESNFFDCSFISGDNFIEIPDYFIRIDNISEIKFIKCDFGNTSSYQFLGNGIHSVNATFYVDGYHTDPSEFRKLIYGIKVENTNTVYFPDIRNSYFSADQKSIYISNADEPRVTSCIFFHTPIIGYGLYLNNSQKYHVEDNRFEGIPPLPNQPPVSRLGIYINNSGGLWNQIYNNYFEYFQYGIIAHGLNRNPFVYSGLCIECNDFSYGVNDIVVNGLENSQHGIARDQGYIGNNDTLPAGNTFSGTSPWLIWNYLNSDGMAFINYVHHQFPLGIKLRPEPAYSSQTMYRDESENTTYSKEIACPSKLETWPNIELERSARENANMEIEQKKDQLEELVDAGDTYMMNFNVLTSSPPEATEVYNDLMSESPYLSDTVLKSAIYKEDVLPNAMIRDVLVANPQSAKDQEIIDAIDDRFTPMPSWMKDQILAGVNYTGAKENLETEIRYWDRKRSEHFENIYRHYKKDTINPQAFADSLVLLLEQDDRLESKYRLAFLTMESSLWSETQQILNSIPNQIELTSLETSVHEEYVTLFTILNQLNGNLPVEGSQEAYGLEMLAADDEHYPGACARNLLIIAGLLDYEEPIVFPEETLKSSWVFEEGQLINSNKSNALNVFPNPALDFFIVDYNAENYMGEVVIKVNDMNGKLQFMNKYTSRCNQEVFNVSDWQAGLYTLSLIINGKTIESKKIGVKH